MKEKETPQKITALAVIQPGSIAVVTDDETARSVPALIEESVEDFFRLPKITVPTSGGKFFTVKDIDGDHAADHVEGVVALLHRKQRAFYLTPYGEGEKGPPDCMSTDGVHGVGKRGIPEDRAPNGMETHGPHDCLTCPWNGFGSKETAGLGKGRGRACREIIRAFIFDDESFVPVVLSVPPSSLGAVRDYSILIARKGIRMHHVRTRVELRTEKVSGYDTSMFVFRAVGRLTKEEARRFDAIHDGLDRVLSPHLRGFLEREERVPRDVDIEPADTPFSPSERAPAQTQALAGTADLTDDAVPSEAELTEAGGIAETGA